MARTSYSTSNLPRIAIVEGHEGEFHLIRQGAKNSRVISVSDKSGSGITVPTSTVTLKEVPGTEPSPVVLDPAEVEVMAEAVRNAAVTEESIPTSAV